MKPFEKYKDLVEFLIIRLGFPAVICGVLMYILWHDLAEFRKEISWKLERSIRNERSIMMKLGIPMIMDSDEHK